MRPWAVALVGLGLLAPPAGAEVMIRVAGAQVDVSATAAPLNEVLDRLARQTGMKVVYEGAAPRQLITISLQGRSPAQAVLSLLEGLGLNYALVADVTGTRVQTLILSGTAPASAAAARSGGAGNATPITPQRRPFAPPPGSAPDFMEAGAEEPEPDEPEEPAGFLPPEGGAAPGAQAAPGAVEPAAPGAAPTPPGFGVVPQVPQPGAPSSTFTPPASPNMPFPPVPPGAPVAPAQSPPEETPAPPPP